MVADKAKKKPKKKRENARVLGFKLAAPNLTSPVVNGWIFHVTDVFLSFTDTSDGALHFLPETFESTSPDELNFNSWPWSNYKC